MNIWIVTREYDGIAEAGGVKNVSCSLSESLHKLGNDVTVFMPLYGCSNLSKIENYYKIPNDTVKIKICGKEEKITFAAAEINGIHIVFVQHKSFLEKQGVYTYTINEEKLNPNHIHGTGHTDSLIMNTLFEKSVVFYAQKITEIEFPDIIHCQDATAALVPVFAKNCTLSRKDKNNPFDNTKFIVTIHNAGPGYHHEFCSLQQAKDFTGLSDKILRKGLIKTNVEPFLLASYYSSLSTVSPEYAKEILSCKTETCGLAEEFIFRNVQITGITNGIDFEKYDPRDTKKSLLPFEFNPAENDLKGKYKCRKYFIDNFASKKIVYFPENIVRCGYLKSSSDNTVYFSYHGRIVHQKGINILVQAASKILKQTENVNFIFMGQGEEMLEQQIESLAEQFPGKCVYFQGYERSLTRICTAASDFIVLPSEFEPCGLEDFIAQIFATIPIAHATGGLSKIINEKTGFLYDKNTPEKLEKILMKILKSFTEKPEKYAQIRKEAFCHVESKYSWENVVKEKYLPFYRKN